MIKLGCLGILPGQLFYIQNPIGRDIMELYQVERGETNGTTRIS